MGQFGIKVGPGTLEATACRAWALASLSARVSFLHVSGQAIRDSCPGRRTLVIQHSA